MGWGGPFGAPGWGFNKHTLNSANATLRVMIIFVTEELQNGAVGVDTSGSS